MSTSLYVSFIQIIECCQSSGRAAVQYLPAVKLVLDWLRFGTQHSRLAERSGTALGKKFWSALVDLLNGLLALDSAEMFVENPEYQQRAPLTEDWEMQGFLPLAELHKRLAFDARSQRASDDDEERNRFACIFANGRVLLEPMNVYFHASTRQFSQQRGAAAQSTNSAQRPVMQTMAELRIRSEVSVRGCICGCEQTENREERCGSGCEKSTSAVQHMPIPSHHRTLDHTARIRGSRSEHKAQECSVAIYYQRQRHSGRKSKALH